MLLAIPSGHAVLRHRYEAAWLLVSEVEILLRARVFVLCCVGGGFYNRLVTHSGTTY